MACGMMWRPRKCPRPRWGPGTVTDSAATRWRFGGRLRVSHSGDISVHWRFMVRSWVLFASHSAAAPDPHSDCVSVSGSAPSG